MLTSFAGRVGVVTGAGSGIGLAMARRFAGEGMKLALGDIDGPALASVADDLRAEGADVFERAVDVSDESSVDVFAGAVISHYGPPHLLCNNAGVGGGWSPLWAATRKDWDWMLGVNLYGVVHGVRAFLPAMLARGEEGHVVNTSSVAGLMTGRGQVYGVTKHAVQRYSEGLYYDLRDLGSSVGVSTVNPGIVATRINTAARNRPPRTLEAGSTGLENFEVFEEMDRRYNEFGMRPEVVADMVAEAVKEDRFYVLTHPEVLDAVKRRADSIAEGVLPPLQPRGEWETRR